MQTTARIALLICLCGAWGAAGTAVCAQDAPTNLGKFGRPFRVKIGMYYPGEGSVRNNSGSTMRAVGLSYDFRATQTTLPLIFGVYVSDAARNRNRTFGKVKLGTETTVTGIGFQARTYFIPNAKTFDYFVGGGVGYYAVHIKTGIPSGKTFVEDIEDSGRIGGKVFGGLEWKKRFFGELEYTFPGSVQAGGQEFLLNGMNVSLGCRF